MMLTRRNTMTALLGAASAGWLGAGRAAAADPVRIGTILSVSGPAAFLGQDMKDGT